MMTSEKLVKLISEKLNPIFNTGIIYVNYGLKSNVFSTKDFESSDKIVELLANLSLTHYIYDIHRFDTEYQTDIDIFIEPSEDMQTNIDADVIEAILYFYTKTKE